MKSAADETGRSKEVGILVKFFKQLQAAATMRITDPGTWISKSSNMGEADCPTTNTVNAEPLLETGCKPVFWGFIMRKDDETR